MYKWLLITRNDIRPRIGAHPCCVLRQYRQVDRANAIIYARACTVSPLRSCFEIDAFDLHRGNGPIDNAYRFQDQRSTMISIRICKGTRARGAREDQREQINWFSLSCIAIVLTYWFFRLASNLIA